MKIGLILNLVVGLSFIYFFPAFAQDCGGLTAATLNEVCQKAKTREGEFQCMAAGKDAHLDACALGACKRYGTDEGTIGCVQAIKNKVFTLEEVLYCNQFDTENESNRCFQAYGRDFFRQIILKESSAAGAQDGAREAEERFTVEEQTNALAVGKRAGQAAAEKKAQSDSVARDAHAGFIYGVKNAASERSMAGSYEAGRKEGEAIALRKAVAEDRKTTLETLLRQLGQQRPARLIQLAASPPPSPPAGDLSGDLSGVVPDGAPVGNPTVVAPPRPDFRYPAFSADSTPVPVADFRYRKPLCDPKNAECIEAYSSAYKKSFQNKIKMKIESAMRGAFEVQAKMTYDTLIKADHPGSTAASMEAGALAQGRLDGFLGRYPTAKNEAIDKARKDFSAAKAKGHWLIANKLHLSAGSIDTVAPGYPIQLSVWIDNLGDAPSPDGAYRIRITESTQTLHWPALIADLPSLPGNSRVLVRGLLSAETPDSLGDGDKISVTAVMESRAGADYSVRRTLLASTSAQYPLQMQSLKLTKVAPLNDWVDATLVVKNSTPSKLSESRYHLTAAFNAASLYPEEVPIPALAPGETYSIPLQMRATVWVGENTGVRLIAKKLNTNGEVELQQTATFKMTVNRSAGISLLWKGQNVPRAVFDVYGQTACYQFQLTSYLSSGRGGPYQIRLASTSDPGIVPIEKLSIRYPELKSGWSMPMETFGVRVPASLKGKRAWAAYALYEGNTVIQMLRIEFQVH